MTVRDNISILIIGLYGALCLLTSCYVSMPENQITENMLPPQSLDNSIAEGLGTPFFSVGNWPDENWWEVFGSCQLNALIAEALEQNPSFQEVSARLEAAYQESVVTRAQLFPWVSFDVTDTKTFLSHNGLYRAFNPTLKLNDNLTDIFYSLQYDCDFWGKNRHLFWASVGEAKAREAEVYQTRLVITAAIVQAYVALKANLLRKDLYERLVEVSFNVLDLKALLKDKALYSRLSVLSLEEAYLETRKLVLRIDEEIALDKHLINILLGRGPDVDLQIDAVLPALPQTLVIPYNLSLDLLSQRPDITAQIWRIEALSHEVGAAMGEFYPDISFTVLLGLESTSFSKLFELHSKTWSFVPALHLPVFTAGAIQANVRANKAAFDEAVFNYNRLVLASAQEVADLLAAGISIYSRKMEQERILESARKRYDLTLLLKQSGLNSLFDAYDVQIELFYDELENIDLVYGQYVTTVKLIKALGGGWKS